MKRGKCWEDGGTRWVFFQFVSESSEEIVRISSTLKKWNEAEQLKVRFSMCVYSAKTRRGYNPFACFSSATYIFAKLNPAWRRGETKNWNKSGEKNEIPPVAYPSFEACFSYITIFNLNWIPLVKFRFSSFRTPVSFFADLQILLDI